MKDVNRVILLGRLGGNPTHRQTKTGLSVAQFSMATSRRLYREDSSGTTSDPQQETQWHRVVVWGKQGENCAQFLKKGNPVYVEGYLRSRNYEDKTGAQRTSFEVHAENVSFLSGRIPNYSNRTHLKLGEGPPSMPNTVSGPALVNAQGGRVEQMSGGVFPVDGEGKFNPENGDGPGGAFPMHRESLNPGEEPSIVFPMHEAVINHGVEETSETLQSSEEYAGLLHA